MFPLDTCYGDVSGFQTVATCRDGLKKSKSATSRTDLRRRHGFVADLSRPDVTGDFGIMEFGL